MWSVMDALDALPDAVDPLQVRPGQASAHP
jgi:hypothetical protein